MECVMDSRVFAKPQRLSSSNLPLNRKPSVTVDVRGVNDGHNDSEVRTGSSRKAKRA